MTKSAGRLRRFRKMLINFEAEIKQPYILYGHEAQKSMKKVDAWLKGLGYEIKD